MPFYPSTSINMGTSSPENRNEVYSGEDLYVLDREQTSFVALFNLSKDYVNSKSNADEFKDFYAGSVGTTLLELASGHSEFNSYNAIVARREDYLYEAQLRDSGIALSSNLGYSVFRGNNIKLTLSFVPSMDIEIQKFDIIGSVGNYDIISLEAKSFKLGEPSDLMVVLGILKIATLNIEDSKTYNFRFSQNLISDDISLKLDGQVVPTSKILYDLVNDYFVVLSNPVGGIDVLYMNRYQPQRWQSYSKYTFLDYVLPTYDWRPNFHYYEGSIVSKVASVDGLPILYECVREGTSSNTEPIWNEEEGKLTSDGILLTWKCIGRMQKQLYFKCISPGTNISGLNEPVWPAVTGQTIIDGNVTWICTDIYEVSKYFYNTGSQLELTYVELEDIQYNERDLRLDIGTITSVSLETTYQSYETLKEMKRNAPLYNETRYVIRGREDFRKIFRMMTPNAVDANGFDPIPAVVELSYVKNHTNRLWTPDRRYTKGDEVLATKDGNNYVYEALTSGYGGLTLKGLSGDNEPSWFTTEIPSDDGSVEEPDIPLVYDNQLVWKAKFKRDNYPIGDDLKWQSNYQYRKGTNILPNAQYPIYFYVYDVNAEPNWPTKLGESVKDNEVTWSCVDTIFFDGYDASYWSQSKQYEVGDYVQPVTSTGYFYKCTKSGLSGSQEPDWRTTICEEFFDNEVTWQCYDRTDASKYVKNYVLDTLEKYTQYGVSPAIMTDPVLVRVHIRFYINTTENIDNVTLNNDIFNVVDKYQRVLESYVDTTILENELEKIDYVKIARATITGDTKTKVWEPGTLYRIKDTVRPKVDNGFIYVANRIETGSYGYSQWTDRSYSGEEEPAWNDESVLAEDKFTDRNLVWQLRYLSELGGIIPDYWEPDTVYSLGSCVLPTKRVNSNLYAKVVEIKYSEPNWPTVVGKSILDGRIYWTCLSHRDTAPTLGWNEYYMFSWTYNVQKYSRK